MKSRENTQQFRQLEALAREQIARAKQQKISAGRISSEVIAEIYRIGNQILALVEDRELDTDDPDYLFGLYTALLRLHQSDRAGQETLHGHADPHTITEIARLEYLLNELQAQYQPGEPATRQPEVIRIREGLQRLLT